MLATTRPKEDFPLAGFSCAVSYVAVFETSSDFCCQYIQFVGVLTFSTLLFVHVSYYFPTINVVVVIAR